MSVRIIPPISTEIAIGEIAQLVLYPGMLGGLITNPLTAIESLYVDPSAPATTVATFTTIELLPGDSYEVIPNSTLPVWVNAATAGHRFQAYGIIAVPVALPVPSTFPPLSPTTMTALMGSYLYKEYDDDDDLQAFVASYNLLGQTFLNTINALDLPIYTEQAGALLDWVAAGIYGMFRPTIAYGNYHLIGPLNTYQFNTLQMNQIKRVFPTNNIIVTDDLFKRILTWAFLKGDGKVFNVRWLKRRIMRFLLGTDGVNFNVDQTYQISVTFGPNNEVTIRFINFTTKINRGAIFNTFQMNTTRFNELDVTVTPLTPLPLRLEFKAAALSGVLELPFQFTYDIEGAGPIATP